MSDKSHLLSKLGELFNQMSAADAANHFLSPFIEASLLNGATAEPGTGMWIVNRSDVYDGTLQMLFDHPLKEISSRAKEKHSLRHSSLHFLNPPEDFGPLEEIHSHDVEEVLGHPLAPFEAMIFFAKSIQEDHRATSALSLTRRLLEHPPNWALNLELKKHLQESFFKMLLEDTSVFARSYAARVPLFESSQIDEALQKESDDFILGRLLQNSASSTSSLKIYLDKFKKSPDSFPFSSLVAQMDKRTNPEERKLLSQSSENELSQLILEFYSFFN